MLFLSLFFFLICLFYACFLFFLAYVWYFKLPIFSQKKAFSPTKVCVIVPARNEAQNLPFLLSDLAKQNFPTYEVWVVDDHSEDETAEVVHFWQKKMPFLHFISLKKEQKGKKAALSEAIRQTEAEWILTTDADCRVGEEWISTVHDFGQQTEAYMLSSLVSFTKPKNFWESLQIVEFASLVGVGAVSLALGKASMANGANLAFRKRIFEEVGGYAGSEHIATGDDEFLLKKIFRKYPTKVLFLKNQKAIVRTKACATWQVFYEQRKRWASKWKLHADPLNAGMAIGVLGFYSLILGFFFGLITGFIKSPIILWAFLIKLFGEVVFLQPILSHLGYRRTGYGIIFWQILYPLYAFSVGLGATFSKYIWKGRIY